VVICENFPQVDLVTRELRGKECAKKYSQVKKNTSGSPVRVFSKRPLNAANQIFSPTSCDELRLCALRSRHKRTAFQVSRRYSVVHLRELSNRAKKMLESNKIQILLTHACAANLVKYQTHCGKWCDPYVEFGWLLIILDLILHRKAAFRHVLLNRPRLQPMRVSLFD
jgi:hypothetical protein